jgi:hypothetical protein
VDTDLTDAPGDGTPGIATRRRLLGAGLTGAALSLLPVAARRAGAQSDGATTTTTAAAGATTSTAPATTTTAPPKRPTDSDITALAFAQTIELAAFRLYQAALAAGGLDDVENRVFVTVSEAHRAFSNSLSAFLGRAASGEAHPGLLAKYTGRFSSPSTRFAAAIEVESAFVATYHDVIGTLRGTDGATLLAGISVAEARHGTVLADASGATDLPTLLDDKPATALKVGG